MINTYKGFESFTISIQEALRDTAPHSGADFIDAVQDCLTRLETQALNVSQTMPEPTKEAREGVRGGFAKAIAAAYATADNSNRKLILACWPQYFDVGVL